jgi:hypothetical protein
MRMLGFKGPAQPSPTLSDALNAGYCYLEAGCLGCDTNQTIALDIVRPKCTPVYELERYMRCRDCSQVRGYPYKRSHLGAHPTMTKFRALSHDESREAYCAARFQFLGNAVCPSRVTAISSARRRLRSMS